MASSERVLALLSRASDLHPREVDLKLTRVEALLARLGVDDAALPPVIHIAGTNGKGSTLAMLRAGLEAAGGRVHAYTSPHLVRFHERIRLAGALIGEDALVALLEEVLERNAGGPITFFEVGTVAALLAFARTPADWTLLEVGVGGRLDATNVVARPRLCVITPVGLDHQEYLGDTLAEIAGEKAGILRRDVPCVLAPQPAAAREAIEAHAARVGAPLLIAGQDWQAWEERGRLIVQDLTGLADLPLPALVGGHQIANAGAAVVALRALGLEEPALSAAVTEARWPARLQRLGPHPWVPAGLEVWLDGGHNPAAATALAAALAARPARPTWLVAGMMARKDAAGFLAPLAARAQGLIAVPVPGSPGGLAPEALAATAAGAGLAADTAPDAASALAVIAGHTPNARVLICGSLYLAGDVLAADPAHWPD